jgi:hypothetical protein
MPEVSQTLSLPDALVIRLQTLADERGLSIEQLLVQWAGEPTSNGGGAERPGQDDELLVACTRALLDGSEPPVAVDWDEIQRALQESEPAYSTIEEAMTTLRRRPWSKDE